VADAARELGVRALGDVDLNLLPVSFIVAHLFAVATDRDESPQRLDHGDVLFELGVLLLDFLYICGDRAHHVVHRPTIDPTRLLTSLVGVDGSQMALRETNVRFAPGRLWLIFSSLSNQR
jgi:hypothetical protein